jgi:hypothetical protein
MMAGIVEWVEVVTDRQQHGKHISAVTNTDPIEDVVCAKAI